jgi:hypothetical protein
MIRGEKNRSAGGAGKRLEPLFQLDYAENSASIFMACGVPEDMITLAILGGGRRVGCPLR